LGFPAQAVVEKRKVFFEGEWVETPIIDREKLKAGNEFYGPAVIVEYSSTSLIPPWTKVKVDCFGNLIVEVENG
jgi:N-methylhydantoinase A